MPRSHRDPVNPVTVYRPGPGTGTGIWYPVPPNTPGKQGTVTTPGRPITPGSTATPGDSVRPVNTGQGAQLEKTDQCLDQSEFSVLNSPGRLVQLEHNVHEQPGDIPILQIEHLSEHSQVDQDLVISDSPDIRSDDSTERLRTHLHYSGFQSSGTGHTVNPLGTGHTGNCSDREHSVCRSRSVRSYAMEHGSDRTRHRSDVSRSSRRDSITHRHAIPLRHTDPGELSPASMTRHRRSRSRSSSYNSVSPRRRSRSSSRLRGKKKKSHKKKKHSSTSSSSSRRSSSHSSRERGRKRHKSKKKKKKHSKSRSSKHDKREKKHKRRRSPTPSPSSSSSYVSSDASSSPRRSPARKKSRIISRSPSPAVNNPHSTSRAESPASHWDFLSLCASNDDEFNNLPSDTRCLRDSQ